MKLSSVLARLPIAAPVVALVAHLGCSSSKSSGGEAPGGDDSGAPDSGAIVEEANGGGTDAPGSTGLSLTWNVTVQSPAVGTGEPDAGDASTPAVPVAGVTVCVNGMSTIPCATSDSTGTFTLAGLPSATDIVVTLVATGYRSLALPVLTGSSAMNATTSPIGMARSTDPDPAIGTSIDWADAGQVQFFALGPGAFLPGTGPAGDPGTAVTFAPKTGVGPLFLTDENAFAAGATALIDVAGVVYNVTPGSYTLTFDDPTGDCEAIAAPFAGWGYPGSAHDVTFPVLAGYTTTAGVYCTKNAHADGGTDAADAGSGDASPADGSSDALAD